MSLEQALFSRSNSQCELCTSQNGLEPYTVAPRQGDDPENSIMACETCRTQLEDTDKVNPNHWRCLNDAMWSEVDAVKVIAYRMLHHLKNEGWPQDLLDMMYLEEETQKWADTGLASEPDPDAIVHKDAHGAVIVSGDHVVLIKDLEVKGANFTAKRGASIRNMRVVHDNAGQVEGKIDGTSVVILTQFVKKINEKE